MIELDQINVLKFINKRFYLISLLKQLPSVAKRNLKDDISKPRTLNELDDYESSLSIVISKLKDLPKNKEKLEKIYNTLFKSNTNIKSIFDMLMNNFGSIVNPELKDISYIEKIVNENNSKIIYKKNNVIVIKATNHKLIQLLGCNALWCFTRPGNEGNNYFKSYTNSKNPIVYICINMNKEIDDRFYMYTVVNKNNDNNDFPKSKFYKNYHIYDSYNNPIKDNQLKDFFKIISFEICNKLFSFL